MIPAVNPINVYVHKDEEYWRIMLELRKFGLVATGDKVIDKARLADAKRQQLEGNNPENPYYQGPTLEQTKMEEERIGAKTIAELNKLFFGL